jgi:hypothetical protein
MRRQFQLYLRRLNTGVAPVSGLWILTDLEMMLRNFPDKRKGRPDDV